MLVDASYSATERSPLVSDQINMEVTTKSPNPIIPSRISPQGTASLMLSYAQARRHVGTLHYGVEATTGFQQNLLLHTREVLCIVRPQMCPGKILVRSA